MKLVYIAHPISGDVENNIQRAMDWCRYFALRKNVVPVAPYLYLIGVLDETDPAERRLGMQMDHEILKRCNELWVCGPKISTGVAAELHVAAQFGLVVRQDWLGYGDLADYQKEIGGEAEDV